jgi:hypothetical protein
MILGLGFALVCALGTNLSSLLKARGAVLARPIEVRHPLWSAADLFRQRSCAQGVSAPPRMTEGYAHVDPGGNRQINEVLHRPPRGHRRSAPPSSSSLQTRARPAQSRMARQGRAQRAAQRHSLTAIGGRAPSSRKEGEGGAARA